jgi:hypothetical protein
MVETLKEYFRVDSDLALTAVVVVPAATVWVTSERITLAVLTGAATYLAYEYGVPFARTHITRENISWLYSEVRELIRSRSTKRA